MALKSKFFSDIVVGMLKCLCKFDKWPHKIVFVACFGEY